MSDEVVKIYVGTDKKMEKAEIALEHSVRKHISCPFEIVWMDFSRGGIWEGWDMGRELHEICGKKGWFTNFTNFRWAIPEANGFKGRAIYLDVDMILLKDIKELFDYPMEKPVMAPPQGFDVMLIDCAAFKDQLWWPMVDRMKVNRWGRVMYEQLLAKHDFVSHGLPEIWDCRDGAGYDPAKTALIHYTDMSTQPWHPYPDLVTYREHPHKGVEKLFWDLYEEAKGS